MEKLSYDEKARRLREDWKDEYNGGVSYESACRLICRLIDPLIAEIDRLKAEAWAGDDDIIHAYKAGNNDMFSGDAQRYLAARRQAKRKE